MIYLDNAATTKTAKEAVEAMIPFLEENYGNPSSIYSLGGRSKKALMIAREEIAKSIGAKPQEIYFTAGGSESDNWALIATAEAYEAKGKHIITSKIEHHAILHTCEYLQKRGFTVTYLDVDENGIIRLEDFYNSYEKQWMWENKPHGFDVQDIRIGGLIRRIKHCKARLAKYIDGGIGKIEELEEPQLDVICRTADNGAICYNSWEKTVSTNTIAGI